VRIDHNSSEPVYLQLAAHLRERIIFGQIKARLPSLTELSAETGLAVGTIRRAIKVLARENRVRAVPGRGTFVTHAGPRGTVPPPPL
jgi:DNA-binding transcriptional regulator YhcF (GntR family)